MFQTSQFVGKSCNQSQKNRSRAVGVAATAAALIAPAFSPRACHEGGLAVCVKDDDANSGTTRTSFCTLLEGRYARDGGSTMYREGAPAVREQHSMATVNRSGRFASQSYVRANQDSTSSSRKSSLSRNSTSSLEANGDAFVCARKALEAPYANASYWQSLLRRAELFPLDTPEKKEKYRSQSFTLASLDLYRKWKPSTKRAENPENEKTTMEEVARLVHDTCRQVKRDALSPDKLTNLEKKKKIKLDMGGFKEILDTLFANYWDFLDQYGPRDDLFNAFDREITSLHKFGGPLVRPADVKDFLVCLTRCRAAIMTLHREIRVFDTILECEAAATESSPARTPFAPEEVGERLSNARNACERSIDASCAELVPESKPKSKFWSKLSSKATKA